MSSENSRKYSIMKILKVVHRQPIYQERNNRNPIDFVCMYVYVYAVEAMPPFRISNIICHFLFFPWWCKNVNQIWHLVNVFAKSIIICRHWFFFFGIEINGVLVALPYQLPMELAMRKQSSIVEYFLVSINDTQFISKILISIDDTLLQVRHR